MEISVPNKLTLVLLHGIEGTSERVVDTQNSPLSILLRLSSSSSSSSSSHLECLYQGLPHQSEKAKILKQTTTTRLLHPERKSLALALAAS